MHPERSEPQLGISYDQLSPEVRPYADNLEAQIWAVFAKYGIVVGEGLAPSHSTKVGEGLAPSHAGGDKPRPYIDELKAKNPSDKDLEHLSDLLDQLDHIRKTGEPMPRTKREYGPPSLEFSYNETEAQRLGLKEVEVKGYPEADKLIQQVIGGTINIETKEGQKQFLEAWRTTCPDLPPPCVPDQNDFSYLTQLRSRRIISNLEGDPKPISPNFTNNEILLVDSWEETDWNAPDAKIKLISTLIKELLDQESVVKVKRLDLEAVLWVGDPDLRIPTEKHQTILKNLDLSPDDFELRLIRQDEYARLAKSQGWGAYNLWTNFDHYFMVKGGAGHGLIGGNRSEGGPSNVSYIWGGESSVNRNIYGSIENDLAVRLVIARKISSSTRRNPLSS